MHLVKHEHFCQSCQLGIALRSMIRNQSINTVRSNTIITHDHPDQD